MFPSRLKKIEKKNVSQSHRLQNWLNSLGICNQHKWRNKACSQSLPFLAATPTLGELRGSLFKKVSHDLLAWAFLCDPLSNLFQIKTNLHLGLGT